MGRAPCCEKVGLKQGRWTLEEDQLLIEYIHANGEGSWRSLPKNAGLLRCGKSCRLRWINYLRAGLKRGNISAEEEAIIIKLHASLGNRWSLIASHLPGRTDNEIKNYWNCHLSRKIDTLRSLTTVTDTLNPSIMDIHKATIIPPKRKGGRTSRWAIFYTQKHSGTEKLPNKLESNSTKKHIGADPLPGATPALENESLSSSPPDDFQVLESADPDHKVNSDGLVCFNDVVDNCLLDACQDEEKECNINDHVVRAGEENDSGAKFLDRVATRELESLNLSLNTGQWYTSSSLMDQSGTFDDNCWDWEKVFCD